MVVTKYNNYIVAMCLEKWNMYPDLKLAIDSGGHVSDLVVARNCCMTRMLPGEAELVSE